MTDTATGPLILHASAAAVAGRGLLIVGGAGRGKTSLLLELLALGAELVADDRVLVSSAGDGVRLSPSPRLEGLVEIRGAGILDTGRFTDAPLWLIADLDRAPAARMPEWRHLTVAGQSCPVIDCDRRPATSATLMAILRAGHLPDPEFTTQRGG